MKIFFAIALLVLIAIAINAYDFDDGFADDFCSKDACNISTDLNITVNGEDHCCDPKKYSFIVGDTIQDNVTQSCTCYE
ncbi:hypothetical protein RRG08_020458 [Elysia crispata]|uniref:Uncharacterized protein n=1 Tax=Elysia crispata TaxID=231223 RepID=A0AAE1D8T4_9GAST|nr:hypothetical protein RRG08_020458 [Elysia crispata]